MLVKSNCDINNVEEKTQEKQINTLRPIEMCHSNKIKHQRAGALQRPPLQMNGQRQARSAPHPVPSISCHDSGAPVPRMTSLSSWEGCPGARMGSHGRAWPARTGTPPLWFLKADHLWQGNSTAPLPPTRTLTCDLCCFLRSLGHQAHSFPS